MNQEVSNSKRCMSKRQGWDQLWKFTIIACNTCHLQRNNESLQGSPVIICISQMGTLRCRRPHYPLGHTYFSVFIFGLILELTPVMREILPQVKTMLSLGQAWCRNHWYHLWSGLHGIPYQLLLLISPSLEDWSAYQFFSPPIRLKGTRSSGLLLNWI